MNDFFKQYQHPNWQKKRLEILERDSYQCQQCGDKENQLQVHHGFYGKDKKPWEYDDRSLSTLCDNCHKKAQDLLNRIKEYIGFLREDDLHRVLGYVSSLASQSIYFEQCTEKDEMITVEKPETSDGIIGMADAFCMNPPDVQEILKEGLVAVKDGRLASYGKNDT